VLLAAEVSKLALAQFRAHLPCEPSNGRRVVVACVEGETHDIGAYMVADFLELAGFDVRFLGANVPTSTLVATLDAQPPGLLALSATTTANLGEVRRVIHAVRATGKEVPIAVGGQLFSTQPALRKDLGVDIYACNPRHLAAATRELLDGPRPQGPPG
jgi:methanogenic corrinoid protein MtbC1